MSKDCDIKIRAKNSMYIISAESHRAKLFMGNLYKEDMIRIDPSCIEIYVDMITNEGFEICHE